MNPLSIINKYYKKNTEAYDILVTHSKLVTQKALEIAEKVKYLRPNQMFILEAAMLHDIGIFKTKTPQLDCYGDKPYLCHGIIGREILENEGFFKHALVCERHIGVGITAEDVEKGNLPLPKRDMKPTTIEEEIICYADLFFSKNPSHINEELTIDEIKLNLSEYGDDKVEKFENWVKKFEK